MQENRVVFDFKISFSNGGGIQGQGFRLDIDGTDISDDELAKYIVRDMRLLMVGHTEILNKRYIQEPHKRKTTSQKLHEGISNLKDKNPALILIDFQKAFDNETYWGGNRNNKDAETNAQLILQQWRMLNLPIFHIRHSSQNPNSLLYAGTPGFELKDGFEPINGEPLITKDVNSAFIGTTLKSDLDDLNVKTVVIIGLTTNHCVSTTTRMAGNYGFETMVVSDATASFDRIGINGEKYSSEVIHLTSLANLKDEFAEILTTKELLEKVNAL